MPCFSEKIRSVKGGYKVKGEKTKYPSKKGAKKRLKQRQFFENLGKSSGGRGSLRAKAKKA